MHQIYVHVSRTIVSQNYWWQGDAQHRKALIHAWNTFYTCTRALLGVLQPGIPHTCHIQCGTTRYRCAVLVTQNAPVLLPVDGLPSRLTPLSVGAAPLYATDRQTAYVASLLMHTLHVAFAFLATTVSVCWRLRKKHRHGAADRPSGQGSSTPFYTTSCVKG